MALDGWRSRSSGGASTRNLRSISMPASSELAAVGGRGAGALAGPCRDEAGEPRALDDRVEVAQPGRPEALLAPPGEQRAGEGVAGADRVGDLDARRRDRDRVGRRGHDGAVAAPGEDADRRAVGEQPARRLDRVPIGVQPGDVLLGDLQEVGALQDPGQAPAVGGRVGDDVGAAVRIDRDERAAGQAVEDGLVGARHRLEDEAERPEEQRPDALGERGEGGLGGQARGRRALRVEAVARDAAALAELGDRERRRVLGAHDGLEADTVVEQDPLEAVAEAVGGQPSEVRGRLVEPRDRAGGVERRAAGMGVELRALARDDVEQRLAADEDRAVAGAHRGPPLGTISPEPRAISVVGSRTVRDGPVSPSRRAKSRSAAVRPTAAASWATTVRPGSRASASGTSSKPTSATSWRRPRARSASTAPIVMRFWAAKSAVGGSSSASRSAVAACAAALSRSSVRTSAGSWATPAVVSASVYPRRRSLALWIARRSPR